MTQNEAAEILLTLKAAYPQADRDLDERTVEARNRLYLGEFQGWRATVAQDAVREQIRVGKWYPTIAELRQHYDLANRPRPMAPERMLPPAVGTKAGKEQERAAFAAVQAILSCEHVALAQAGRLPNDHPCKHACVHRQAYEKAWAR